jgi:3-oxoacyl-[acyl-carrier protein] reductase
MHVMTNTTTTTASAPVALVTGGSRGIGAAILRRLAREGYAVAFTYVAATAQADAIAAEIAAAGGQALALRADSADAAQVQGAVAATVQRFGRLDLLVNNAGILTLGAAEDVTLEDFDRMVAVNLRAPFVAAQAAARHMGQGGRIVTIGSVAADRTGFPGASIYSMTKAGVAVLMRGLALDLAARGITVNTIQPGPTETDMTPADGAHTGTVLNAVPLRRLARAEEIAGMVAYLASAEAGFVTGAALNIDGGYLA